MEDSKVGEPDLGKLEHVDVRRAWEHEAHEFTPWLADNLGLLAAEMGTNLILEATELQVGPYRADIVARIPEDDTRVLIENQLEGANLQHLGQVIAYLAGLEARVVVWVTTRFNDTHLSAIRWLNEHTAEPFAFFAVRISVVRIGDSPLAPIFEVEEGPNEWDRQVRKASGPGELTELGSFRRAFWTHYLSRKPGAPGLRPDYAGNAVFYSVDEAGIRVVQYLAADSVGIYLIGKRGDSNDDASARIKPYVARLRRALKDDSVTDENHRFRGRTYTKADMHERTNWDRACDWLDCRRESYDQVLRERLTDG